MLATGFSQLIQFANNFAAVPFFIAAWGIDGYGSWLTLTALVSILLAVADAGIGPVSANALVTAMGQGREDHALSLFQTTWCVLTASSLAFAGAATIFILFAPFGQWMHLSSVVAQTARPTALSLLAVVIVAFQIGVVQAAMRAIGLYARGVTVQTTMTLVEVAAVCLVLFLRGAPYIAALVMVACRIGCLAILVFLSRRRQPWLRHGWRHASLATFLGILPSAGWFMCFPFANALLIQGSIIALNLTAGPAFVAMFSVGRTLSRSLLQSVALISGAAWPEVTLQFAKGNLVAIRAFLTHGGQFVLVWMACAVGLVFLSSDLIFKLWLHGRLAPPTVLLALLLIEAALLGVKGFSDTLVMATNRHEAYAKTYLAAHVVFFVLGVGAAKLWGGTAFQIAMTGLALFLVLASHFYALQVAQMTRLAFLRDICDPRSGYDAMAARLGRIFR